MTTLPDPVEIVNELNTVYDPTPESETKVLVLHLTDQLFRLEAVMPSLGKASRNVTSCVFSDFRDAASLCKDVCSRLGIDVNATIDIDGNLVPVNDFSFPTYDDFLQTEQQIDNQLSLSVPNIKERWPNFSAGFADDTARVVISKLLAAIGVIGVYDAFIDVLEEIAPDLLSRLARAIAAGDWELVKILLSKLMKIIGSKKFFQKLVAKIGQSAAKRIIGQIMARFLPIVGWIFVIGSVIWAFAEQYFSEE